MVKKICFQKKFSTKHKLKKILLYTSRKWGAEKSWGTRHSKVFESNISYRKPCISTVEAEHQRKWSAFRKKVDLSTLRICKNISDIADANIVPEDIFVSDIEPSLIDEPSVDFLSNKSFYNKWFEDGIFPNDILHCINGRYFDKHLNEINFLEFRRIAQKQSYPIVFKPNWETYGGKGIKFLKNCDELIHFVEEVNNFVVQEQIQQNSFFKKYNQACLNTIRVYLYRSVIDDQVHILSMALRMGKDGSLDNETAGGIHCLIRPDGRLNGFAVDKYGKKYYKHPNSLLKFDSTIPDFKRLKELAIKVTDSIYFTRIIGLDMCYDNDSNWRVIEINTKGHSIRFSQYGGRPFFGKFTNEVIDYCKNNHWILK